MEGSDFVDDIVQDQLPEHTAPSRDQFLPWHRVRKEFIRKYQWNDLTRRMIERYWKRELHQPEDEWTFDESGGEDAAVDIPGNVDLRRTLNCLVIPGSDLLDLRALWRDIHDLNCPIKYLGFNESQDSNQADTEVHISNNAVTSLRRVSRVSRVLRDRFETIALDNSQALRYLKEYGPYHVVNLDLCGSLFPNTDKSPQEYYDALHKLLAYQFEHQRSEWLLFVTTIVKPSSVDEEHMAKLCSATRENVTEHSEFADKAKSMFPPEMFANMPSALNLSALTPEQMVRLFGIAFGKWLIKLCQNATPQWTIAMRKSYSYSISKDFNATMLSFAFALKPNITPPQDTSGMTSIALSARRFPDERECAAKLLISVSNIRDVDNLLESEEQLKEALRDAQADLLGDAGYDRAAYLEWVSNGEVLAGEN
jgi:hypothetical protein